MSSTQLLFKRERDETLAVFVDLHRDGVFALLWMKMIDLIFSSEVRVCVYVCKNKENRINCVCRRQSSANNV